MKTKFLVFLIFTGLIAIDLSCTGGFGGGGCKDVRYDVIGIDTIFPLTKNSKGQFAQLTKDSVKYDSLFYSISFTEKETVYNSRFSLINNSYADPCPSAYTDWSIDSVKIFSINSTFKTDVTNQFSVEGYSAVKAKIDNLNPEFMRQLNSQFNNASPLRFYKKSEFQDFQNEMTKFHQSILNLEKNPCGLQLELGKCRH